jgi:ketosteroid isomerase-like protein
VGSGENAAVVQAIMDAFNRRDLDAALVHFGPESAFYPVSTRALGREEPFVGHDGLREYFEITSRDWDDLEIEPVRIQETRETVTVIGEARGRGPGGELRATAVWTWKLKDRLVVECRVHSDPRHVRAALGRMDEAPSA